MKKLMFVAVAVLAAAAYADCGKEPVPQGECAEVYNVVMSLKTTVCKCKALTTKTAVPCGKETSTECVAWREVASKKVEGVIWSCGCTCIDYAGASIEDPDGQLFWIAKDKIILNDEIEIDHLYRIGKKNEKVEFAANYGALRLAGTGSFDAKNMKVKSVSGSVAGLWLAQYDCADETLSSYCPNYGICDLDLGVDETVAYGTFTIKYNASTSKKFAAGKADPVNAEKFAKYEFVDYYCE